MEPFPLLQLSVPATHRYHRHRNRHAESRWCNKVRQARTILDYNPLTLGCTLAVQGVLNSVRSLAAKFPWYVVKPCCVSIHNDVLKDISSISRGVPEMDEPQTNEFSTRLSEMQHSVQRKLGRCMLRLQQYEAMLKRMLPYASFSSQPAQLPVLLDDASNSIKSKTLGSLVRMLTEAYLRPPILETSHLNHTPPGKSDIVWFSSRAKLVFDVEYYEAIKSNLKDLVNLRNELAHHFLDRFDIACIDSCAEADAFLDNSYRSIDSHFSTLSQWAKTMNDVQALIASVLQSPTFQDFISDGIAPDGTVHWNVSGIVQGLRDAEAELSRDNWTPLNSAIVWMGRHAPEQTPKRYGCSSWRQVLHESKEFDVYRKAPSAALQAHQAPTPVIWYRSRRLPFER